MENSMTGAKVLGALILGTAIGGAVGVLFAPDKGSRTRRKLLASGEDAADAMKDKFNDFMDDFKKEIGSLVKNKVSEYADHIPVKTDKYKVS